MLVEGLELPKLLLTLLETGVWPSAPDAIHRQQLHSLIREDRNRKLRRICLYPPPFRTMLQSGKDCGADEFMTRFGAVHELVTEATIPIADFGLGADSPIMLDYRRGPTNPAVINLEWPGNGEAN